MGMVFGKVTVEEPVFKILLERAHPPATTAYEIREYGKRFAIEAFYEGDSDDGTPFRLLAGYIGVFGNPQNEGQEKISMTAPVMRESKSGGQAIAMTAPVVRSNTAENEEIKMQFVLPSEFDDISKIPKPTDSRVHVVEIPPAVGAVHRFHGSYEEDRTQSIAVDLAKQLSEDGIQISEAEAIAHYQFWGYNPPFTIPFLRRNEVWIEMTQDQVDSLKRSLFGNIPQN
mmetsp:Transcript_464/g.695  ORF Transcript_464/g.695 Transcript_464/m.695 type:complete len:228 (-) Transcript_464:3474-4157(-)|eukprot:CAMPEP_0195327276 /NCGR_PEP_ID=MMETSP0708-20121125/10161_1 /TAXON_ID=33640 /ORGANISM="Asterionellopsis glacialis, Strain CCMP134" /LENGTH=227 /DNA_ID=CAMNT_0040394963 /DNA_START=76 /DNA_END=759 /DNA_ORIENTATION=-